MSLAQVVPVGKVVYVTSVCYICIYTAATGLISLTTAELRPVRSVIWYPTCGKKPFPEVHIKKTVISVCTVWRTLLSLTLRSYYGRPVCQWQAFWSGIMTSSLRAVRFLSGGPHAHSVLSAGVVSFLWLSESAFPPCKSCLSRFDACSAGIAFLVVCDCNEQSSYSNSVYCSCVQLCHCSRLPWATVVNFCNHAFPLRCLL